ncbi:MAG: hypothetical protein MUC94_19055 [bacterium]|nr:hypothetical protein [bacterium]
MGDLLLKWMEQTDSDFNLKPGWSNHRLIGISSLMFGFLFICLVGLQARWLWQTTFKHDGYGKPLS